MVSKLVCNLLSIKATTCFENECFAQSCSVGSPAAVDSWMLQKINTLLTSRYVMSFQCLALSQLSTALITEWSGPPSSYVMLTDGLFRRKFVSKGN
jgi:hypothetical protein